MLRFPTHISVQCAVILSLAVAFCGCRGERTFTVKTKTVALSDPSQIVMLTDSAVKPILYTNIRGFENLQSQKAKMKFVSAVLPSILVSKHELEMAKVKMRKLQDKKEWQGEDSIFYSACLRRYGVDDGSELIRMQTLPNSIILAQAAIETGWGQSRFFVEGLNMFGIWSMNESDERMEAGKTRQNKKIYVKRYPHLSECLRDYFSMLSRGRAYKSLRVAQMTTEDPEKLIPHLRNYSEQKIRYTEKLSKIIAQNGLVKYDRYFIDPAFLLEE